MTRVTPLHGGDLSEVLRLTLEDGRSVVAKSGPAPVTEAAMLGAIAAAGAPAPRVLASDTSVLVLEERPDTGGFSAAAWGDLGTQLRRLHATTGPHYGWKADYAFGPLPICNTPHRNWPAFWADNRLLPELAQLPQQVRAPIERIAVALPDHLPADPPSSLLHGDLWTGNVMVDGPNISALIDPACYFGHGEVDLAMLEAFGRPAPAFWDSYGAPDGNWPIRRAIYQLWPAIVHLRLFGTGYLSMSEHLIRQVLA